MAIVSLLKKTPGAPQSTSFGGSNGPYIGTLGSVKPPYVPTLPTGGIINGGPYIGTYPIAPPSGGGGAVDPGAGGGDPGAGGGGDGGGGGGGGGGVSDDYMNQILSHPLGKAALQAYTDAVAGSRGDLRELIRSSVIQSGYVPDLQGELAQYADDIDEQTKAAALGNQTSQAAQLAKARQNGMTSLAYALAARGTGSGGRGGAMTVGSGQLEDQVTLARAQQLSALQDAIRGGIFGMNDKNANARTNYNNALYGVAGLLAGAADGTPPVDNTPIVPGPAVGEDAPAGYAPLGSTVAASASPGTYTVGGIQIKPPVYPVPKGY